MKNKKDIQKQIVEAVNLVKKTTPLVGSITNPITINFVANAQLAVGGSAAMVYLPDEAEFLLRAGDAFYINMGGMIPIYEQTMPMTAQALSDNNKPWVLDPVAIGIGEMRTGILTQFKEFKPTIIRGNASEIIGLASLWKVMDEVKSNVRGVDSGDSVSDAKEAAVALAKWTGGAVSVSGDVDLVTDGSTIALSHGGTELMTKITGSGCSLGGVSAVYAAVTNPFIAALAASAVYNLAGQRAATKSEGPGSFQVQFLDSLFKASAEDIAYNQLEIMEV